MLQKYKLLVRLKRIISKFVNISLHKEVYFYNIKISLLLFFNGLINFCMEQTKALKSQGISLIFKFSVRLL